MTRNQKGRPPSNPPKLAYDFRRAILIVQVLATMEGKGKRSALEVLAVEWLHYPGELAVQVADEELLAVLTQHALQHAHDQ
jgi:hypothetical protein